MSDVPSDSFREILLRLPAESLLRFRCVCKAWCRTIDDLSFIKSHTIKQQHSESFSLLIRDNVFGGLYFMSLSSLNMDDGAEPTVDLTRLEYLIRPCVPLLGELPTTSCHGLILISHINFTKTWAIWNPLTRECRELCLPDHVITENDIKDPLVGVGFGYDYATDDYKVVRICDSFRDFKHVFLTHVYSLKSSSWKAIKDFPCDLMLWSSSGVYANGALYWLSHQDMVIALDLGSEEYRLLPMPPLPMESTEMYMDSLDDCLFLSLDHFEFDDVERWEIWMMKKDEWIKLISFVELDSDFASWGLRPVAYSKSRGQVYVQRDSIFYCLDIHKDSRKMLTIHGIPACITCHNLKGSLFRLHNDDDITASAQTGVNVKNIDKALARLRLSVTVENL